MRKAPNTPLQETFNPPPTFAFAKACVAANTKKSAPAGLARANSVDNQQHFVVFGVLVLHISAALQHGLIRQDSVLPSMLLKFRSRK